MKTPMVVLVHGAWHGGWCWSALQSELDRRGVPSLAPDLPGHGSSNDALGSLDHDARSIATLIRRLDRPVVLVGHSYGGMVITEACGMTDQVRSLVYVAAFMGDTGESPMSLLGSFEPRDVALSAVMRPGPTEETTTIDPAGAIDAFYHLSSTEVGKSASERLDAQHMGGFMQPLTSAGWRSVRSTYVVCSQDRALHPDHQAEMARRASSAVVLESDHSPFLCRVVELAGVVSEVAKSP